MIRCITWKLPWKRGEVYFKNYIHLNCLLVLFNLLFVDNNRIILLLALLRMSPLRFQFKVEAISNNFRVQVSYLNDNECIIMRKIQRRAIQRFDLSSYSDLESETHLILNETLVAIAKYFTVNCDKKRGTKMLKNWLVFRTGKVVKFAQPPNIWTSNIFAPECMYTNYFPKYLCVSCECFNNFDFKSICNYVYVFLRKLSIMITQPKNVNRLNSRHIQANMFCFHLFSYAVCTKSDDVIIKCFFRMEQRLCLNFRDFRGVAASVALLCAQHIYKFMNNSM